MTGTDITRDEQKDQIARFLLDPEAHASFTLQKYAGTQWEGADFNSLVAALTKQINATCQGDMGNAHKALAAQALVLDVLFQTLCRKAIIQPQPDTIHFNRGYLNLALKCQKQAAATSAMLQHMVTPEEKSKNGLLKIE